MSYERYDTRRRRPLYAPPSTTRRSTLGYWVPLVLTVTVATVGIAAWIWSERQDGHDVDGNDRDTNDEIKRPDYPARPVYGHDEDATREASDSFDAPPPSYHSPDGPHPDDDGFFARVSSVVRRSPSPQQLFDNAGQRLAAGVAAAGAAVGLRSVREEGRHSSEREGGFSDHERWSEEVESKRVETQSAAKSVTRDAQSGKARPRRTVAVVLSADTSLNSTYQDEDVEHRTEHAVCLDSLFNSRSILC